MTLGEHISHRFGRNLEDIRNNVLAMGGLVEAQTDNAIKALLEGNAELAEEVSVSDYKINKMEVAIDEQCVQVIARNQPAASDLRLVIAVVKVITDLERIGDEAEKIGRYSIKLAKQQTVNRMHNELSHLSHLVASMLHDALDAFARMDMELALKIVAKGDQINTEYNNVSRLLITHMMEDPRNIKSVLRVTWCARSLERIGDHSRNICEYVVYLVNGEDIRHANLDDVLSDHFPSEEDDE